jgi:nucleolar complex protein 2
MDDEDDVMDEADDEEGEGSEEDELPILTTDMLKTWQSALLEVSLFPSIIQSLPT